MKEKNSRIRCWSDFSKLLAYQNLSQCLTKLLRKFEKNRHIIFLFCFSVFFSFFADFRLFSALLLAKNGDFVRDFSKLLECQ